MRSMYLNLNKILNIPHWQKLQDSYARTCKMAIITVDYKGTPVTEHSCPRPFCEYIRRNPEYRKYCQRCDSRGGLESVRLNAPYIYRCHCGVVDVAVPIIADGKYIGATLAGQIRLSEEEAYEQLEQILISPTNHLLRDATLWRLYEELPVLHLEEVRQGARTLFDLCSYIIAEAMSRNLLSEMYENNMLYVNTPSKEFLTGYSQGSMVLAKQTIETAMMDSYVTAEGDVSTFCKNDILKPAFEYIHHHKSENIRLNTLAKACHLSPSHFSRLFSKEVGESLPKFLARQKIEWSKQLLCQTALPISQISDQLGFCDCCYFVKMFKKYESVTPAYYRKYYK